MPAKFTLNVFCTLICLCALALASFAQEKAQALKFDEFEENSESSFLSYPEKLNLTERVKRFNKQFKKERGAKACIIYYLGRITESDYYRRLGYIVDKIQSEVRVRNDYTEENVIKIFGGYRERMTIEFWIVPKDGELPKSSPTLDKSETFACPKIYVYSRNLFNEPDTLMFSFSEYKLKEFSEATSKWKVSGGEIIGEPKKYEIKVKLNDNTQRATAFLEINGLPYPCPKVFSDTVEFKDNLHLIDEYGIIPNGDTRSRLDHFASQLNNNPTAKGFIINYGSRTEGKKFAARRETLTKNHLAFRNFDMSRITFINGGYREEETTSLWLAFEDTTKPILTPTVDEKFVIVFKSTTKTRVRKKSK